MNRTTILIEDALTKLYIDLSELVYAQADRNYTDIYLSNGRTKSYLIPISKVMEKIESVSLFAASSIKRIGRSHIINLNYVERIDFKRKEVHLKDINVTKLSCGRDALKTLDDALKKKKAVNVLKQVRVQHSIHQAISHPFIQGTHGEKSFQKKHWLSTRGGSHSQNGGFAEPKGFSPHPDGVRCP